MSEILAHPKGNQLLKKMGIVLLSIVVIAGIAYGTITILSIISPKAQNTTQSPTPQQQGAASMQAAAASESTGDTAAAIASYKEALMYYQTAGDKAGEEGVKLKLQYLESLK